MSTTLQLTRSVANGGVTYGSTETVTVDALATLKRTIAAGASNVQYIFPVDFSQLQFVFLKGSAAMTLKTNSSGSPTDTISLVAGSPKIWKTGDASGLNPFTADVTLAGGIFVTSVAGGTLEIMIGYDDTP